MPRGQEYDWKQILGLAGQVEDQKESLGAYWPEVGTAVKGSTKAVLVIIALSEGQPLSYDFHLLWEGQNPRELVGKEEVHSIEL